MILRRHHVELADLQGNVLCGYGQAFRWGDYLLVEIVDSAAGRRFVSSLAGEVTSAAKWAKRAKPLHTLNVSISCEGLRKLGLPEPIVCTFPDEFLDGMKARHKELGDTGRSKPEEWEDELQEVNRHHLLLTLMARDPDVRIEQFDRLRTRVDGDEGLRRIYHQPVELLRRGSRKVPFTREHFGFADGFSQPAIRGNAGPYDKRGMGSRGRFPKWRSLAPGEFVLGYPGEDKVHAPGPDAPLARNGSFTVFRKLAQDVRTFDAYIEQHLGLQFPGRLKDEADRREQLAAKIVGRWMDGRSLVRSSVPSSKAERERNSRLDRWVVSFAARLGRDRKKLAPWLYRRAVKRINEFDYADDDPEGFACPLGAHARRANPRDALGWHAKLSKRHRIIRRSMPYGSPPEGRDPPRRYPADPTAYDGDRGLVFICHQASIKRQFEVIQSLWLNDGDAFWLGHEKDFLAAGREPEVAPPRELEHLDAEVPRERFAQRGRFEPRAQPAAEPEAAPAQGSVAVVAETATGNGSGDRPPEPPAQRGRMTIQGRPPAWLEPQPHFVTLKGGGYFFTPGLSALRALSRAYWL